MAIRNPVAYRNSRRRRETAWISHLDAIAEQARADLAREKRAKHPRKKQPRHVKIAQPMKPLNPHQK
jgi:hypothetical protein